MIHDQQTLYPAYIFTCASAFWLAGICITLVGRERIKNSFLAFLMLAGCILAITGALISWTTTIEYNQLPWISFGLAPADSRIDPFTVPFIMLLGLLGSASAIASPSHITSLNSQSKKEKYWTQTFILMIGILHVLLAANAIAFLVFWEIMSLSSAALVAADHVRHRVQKAA